MKVTSSTRKQVADEMGYAVDDQAIKNAVDAHAGESLGELKQHLRDKNLILEHNGGRGVELADEIDTLRIAIAVREVPDGGGH